MCQAPGNNSSKDLVISHLMLLGHFPPLRRVPSAENKIRAFFGYLNTKKFSKNKIQDSSVVELSISDMA